MSSGLLESCSEFLIRVEAILCRTVTLQDRNCVSLIYMNSIFHKIDTIYVYQQLGCLIVSYLIMLERVEAFPVALNHRC